MKKLLFVTLLALASLNINAQQESGLSGTWWVAGNLNFGNFKNEFNEIKQFSIMPIVGKFIKDDVTIGLGVGYSKGKSINNSTTYNEYSSFTVQPLVRKYWNLKGDLYLFGQAALPISSSDYKSSHYKNTGVSLNISPGLDYKVNNWLTFETSINLLNVGFYVTNPEVGDNTLSYSFNADTESNSFGSLNLGLKFLF